MAMGGNPGIIRTRGHLEAWDLNGNIYVFFEDAGVSA